MRGHRKRLTDKICNVKTSLMFAAILDCILQIQPRVNPPIADLCASGNLLLARMEGDVGYNNALADTRDLLENINGISRVAELTDEEHQTLLDLTNLRVYGQR